MQLKEAHWSPQGALRQHSEKRLEMKVYSDVDFYILKPEVIRK